MKHVSKDANKRKKQLSNIKAKLPEGQRYTKLIRFTLPCELADKLEALPKADRDKLMIEALKKA